MSHLYVRVRRSRRLHSRGLTQTNVRSKRKGRNRRKNTKRTREGTLTTLSSSSAPTETFNLSHIAFLGAARLDVFTAEGGFAGAGTVVVFVELIFLVFRAGVPVCDATASLAIVFVRGGLLRVPDLRPRELILFAASTQPSKVPNRQTKEER